MSVEGCKEDLEYISPRPGVTLMDKRHIVSGASVEVMLVYLTDYMYLLVNIQSILPPDAAIL